jgi:hypothetical protein
MSIYITRQNHQQRDLLPEFRDFKLKLIQSEIDFSVSKEVIKEYRTELSFIRNNFKNDIISGSIALVLLGLIHRVISDIDILIKDENRYSGYINDIYGDDESGNMDNRLGYIEFKYKPGLFSKTRYYEVDFFKNVDTKYIEFDFEGTTLKIQHPLEIISAKMGMTRSHKHYRDLEIIFRKFDI